LAAHPLSVLTGKPALDRLIVAYSRGSCPTTTGAIVPVASFRDPHAASGQCAHSADHFTSLLRTAGVDAHVDRWDEDAGAYSARLRVKARPSVAAQLCDAMLSVVDERDSNTGAHERTVGVLAQAVARELGLNAVEIQRIARAAEMHDIGKVATPDTILRKRGRLTRDERAIMQQHSVIGARMLAVIPALADLVELVRHHHERWDGSGYPDGLQGERIPVGARILAVADSYEAMTADRSYRARMNHDQAMAELRCCSGSQFDPRAVAAFERVITGCQAGVRVSRHYLTLIQHERDTYTVDWTASQLGCDAFPLVQRQRGGTWEQTSETSLPRRRRAAPA
jgi:putative nucleotidyltransferase with HDIG domain